MITHKIHLTKKYTHSFWMCTIERTKYVCVLTFACLVQRNDSLRHYLYSPIRLLTVVFFLFGRETRDSCDWQSSQLAGCRKHK